jgi:hypothetical protein
MFGMGLQTFGWVLALIAGTAILFLHVHPGNLDIVRFSVAFTLIGFAVRELWRISRKPAPSSN